MLFRNSSLLLLDEPSSSLDVISQKKIFNNVFNKINDKIVIYITHRIKVAKEADRIIVLDKGKIVGYGEHTEPLKSCNKYKIMYDKEFN